MTTLSATASGTFRIGDKTVHRLGFGAMRITGDGVWGPPGDVEESLRVLRRLGDLQVNFIDTADAYGPDISEPLIARALRPYADDLLIATKGGLTRTGPNQWPPVGRPEYLIQQAHKSLRQLGVERIDLWQLHRIDPKVPADEQFDAIKSLLADGVIARAGLSEVGVEDIQTAGKYFDVAAVQNRYNLIDRTSEAVLEHCAAQGIGFIPWFPLAAGELAKPGGVVDAVAKKYDATPGQIALAWVLKRSPVMLPIPGTSKVSHLEQNIAAAAIELADADFEALDQAGRKAFAEQQAA